MKRTSVPPQRFFSILGKGLQIGLESTFQTEVWNAYPSKELLLNQEFGHKRNVKTVSLRHPAKDNVVDFTKDLLLSPDFQQVLVITFQGLPPDIAILFQRVNVKVKVSPKLDAIGFIFGRFGEDEPFVIKTKLHCPRCLDGGQVVETPYVHCLICGHKMEEGYANLDFFSRTKEWNPVFVKYRLSVTPVLKDREYGYLKIDAKKEEKGAVITILQVPESEVPEFLKTARTFPQ